jgi:hypothetical protein
MSRAAWMKKALAETGVSKSTFYQLSKEALIKGMVEELPDGTWRESVRKPQLLK